MPGCGWCSSVQKMFGADLLPVFRYLRMPSRAAWWSVPSERGLSRKCLQCPGEPREHSRDSLCSSPVAGGEQTTHAAGTQRASAPHHNPSPGRPQVSTYIAQLMLDTSASLSRGCDTINAFARGEGSYSLGAHLVS